MRARIGTAVAAVVTRRGVDYTSLRQDLALSGKTFEAVMGRKVLLFVGGFLGALAVVTLFVSTGVARLPPGLPIVAGLGFGLVLFFMPDIDARAAANRRRKDFRHALSQYLDLVVLDMAGSAAPAEALPKVAAVLQGWPMALIQDTLYRATRAGTDPWDALTNLGTRIGVSELRDLGQLVKLVAHDGAKIRQTLHRPGHHHAPPRTGRLPRRRRGAGPVDAPRADGPRAGVRAVPRLPRDRGDPVDLKISSPPAVRSGVRMTPDRCVSPCPAWEQAPAVPRPEGEPPMTQAEFLIAWLTVRTADLRKNPDQGDGVQWAIVVGIGVAIAIAVGAILMTKATDTVNNVKVQ